MILLAEEMDWVESAAFTMVVPAGAARDPQSSRGLANLTSEMIQRGCGDRSSRDVVEYLDRLGTDHTAAVTAVHSSFAAATLADKLVETLAVYADTVRRPQLRDDQLEDARLVCLQELQAMEDDLAQRTLFELRRITYGEPWGRAAPGTRAALARITHDEIARFHAANYAPQGTILAVAGKIDWPQLQEDVLRLFGDWSGQPQPVEEIATDPQRYLHIPHDSSQTQIGLSYPSIPYRHDDYFLLRGAVGVLSDGMSSRLFTEVRENRGLCYSVYAMHHTLRDRGAILCYAGTSTERAQETLDVIVAEIARLSQGIDPDELTRLKARTKSALIMQQESSGARAGAVAGDWYHLGYVRTMEEINELIDGLTCDAINTYLQHNPPRDFSVVTLGSAPLEIPIAIS